MLRKSAFHRLRIVQTVQQHARSPISNWLRVANKGSWFVDPPTHKSIPFRYISAFRACEVARAVGVRCSLARCAERWCAFERLVAEQAHFERHTHHYSHAGFTEECWHSIVDVLLVRVCLRECANDLSTS